VVESALGGLVTLLAFLFMLGLLVLVHELGHFLTAVWLGIKVDEFGLGYPPRAAVLFERNGVKYTLNWLPIGGFVRFGGDGESIYGSGGSLQQAAPWRKIIVLVAGPLMNLLLACAIFAGLYIANGVPTAFDGARISRVYPGTPAEQAGIQGGDILLELAGTTIGTSFTGLAEIARQHEGRAVTAVVERGGERLTLSVTPRPWVFEDEQRPAGFGFSYGPNIREVKVGLPQAIGAGVVSTFEVLAAFLDGLRTMLLSLLGLTEPPPGGVTGVVGMARGTGEVIQASGWVGFLRWTALISLNLFLINLLPIPALDGSHIVFSLVEIARRGKKIPPEKEAMVHAVGFMVLMGLMVLITISDVANWIRGAPVLGGG
jgi:regulator of sigma E protease